MDLILVEQQVNVAQDWWEHACCLWVLSTPVWTSKIRQAVRKELGGGEGGIGRESKVQVWWLAATGHCLRGLTAEGTAEQAAGQTAGRKYL